ncbi:hypothetical protein QBC40DRAFT_261385 [Triangularia verruculosa]|uniref:Uncharacterized protein n=1 Tax=Triangularia verruculosa TaxID=2587418 RepID=A0AAN7AZZ8_9PEZI|nr:hypothetical protein QBC40DRAFT_261385 [Triangularia verruculosa]
MDTPKRCPEGFKKLRKAILAGRGTHYIELPEFYRLTPDDHDAFQRWSSFNCPASSVPWAGFFNFCREPSNLNLLNPEIIENLTLTMSLSSPPSLQLPIAHDDQYLYRLTINPYDLTSTGDNIPYCPHLKQTTPSPYFDYHILALANPYINPLRNRRDRLTNPNFCAPSVAGCQFAFFQLGPLSYAPHDHDQSCDKSFISQDRDLTHLDWKPTGFNLVLRLEFDPTGKVARSSGVYAIYNSPSPSRPAREICECGKSMLHDNNNAFSFSQPLNAPNLRSSSRKEDRPFWAAPQPGSHDINQFHVARVADSLPDRRNYQNRIRWEEKIWAPVELVRVPKPGQNPVVAEEELPTVLGTAERPRNFTVHDISFPLIMVLVICLASWIKASIAW